MTRIRFAISLALVAGCVDHGSSQFEPPIDNVAPSVIDPDEPPWDLPTARPFERWLKCMRFDDFQASGMTAAWNAIATNSASKCADCHESGGDGMIVSLDETKFFSVISKKYFALQYFTQAVPVVEWPIDVRVNEVNLIGIGTGKDPHREHPQFDPRPAFPATQNFIDRTSARYDAGPLLCGQ